MTEPAPCYVEAVDRRAAIRERISELTAQLGDVDRFLVLHACLFGPPARREAPAFKVR